MSLGDMFQQRVDDVKETGLALHMLFVSMESIMRVIPDDDDTAAEQRAERNRVRETGRVIRLADIHSQDSDSDAEEAADENEREEGEEEEEENDVDHDHSHHHHHHHHQDNDDHREFEHHSTDGHNATQEASSDAEQLAEVDSVDTLMEPPGTDAGENTANDQRSSRSSSFVSPTSMPSDQHFPSHESLLAESAAAADSSSDVEDELSSERNIEARMREVEAMQLRIFDYDPRQWLLHFICVATKYYSEQCDEYFQCVYSVLNVLSMRRRRIKKLSERLRELVAQQQQQQQQQPATLPTHDDNNNAQPAGEGRATGSAPTITCVDVAALVSNIPDDELELTEEEVQQNVVGVPDHLQRVKASTINSLFSFYVAMVMRDGLPMASTKRLVHEVSNICSTLSNYPKEPLDIVMQLHQDAADQAEAFFNDWMEKGEGRLAPVMLTETAETDPHHPHSSGGERDDDAQSRSSYYSYGTVGSQSVMDSEGNLIDSTAVPDGEDAVTSEEMVGVSADHKRPKTDNSHGDPRPSLHDTTTDDAKSGDGEEEEEETAPLPPPVSSSTAHDLIAEHLQSRTPCCTRLSQLIVETVPGMGRSALLPCIEQPERHAFNEGYTRLAPYMTPEEEELLTTWMQVRLTEIDGDSSWAAETAIVRAWASPTYDPKGGELTLLINPTNAFRMQLSNPAGFSVSGMQCDMCCLGGRNVSYQAVLDGGVRSEVVVGYEGCVGYDVCVACSYYYYKACEVRLLRAVHPDPAVRRPFAYGKHSQIVVQSLRVVADNNNSNNNANKSSSGSSDDDQAEAVVEVLMGVSPFGVLPIAWVLPATKRAELQRVCPLSADEDAYVQLTEAEHAALPVPDAQWSTHCRVTNVSKRMFRSDEDTDDAEADVCPICLQALHSPLPVLRTLCGHWFHVECIGSHYHYKPAVVDGEVNDANGCPVCRSTEYMPSLTNVAETLQTNVYRLEVRVPAAELPAAVAVGTILTDDGVYHNATNVAACVAYYDLAPGYEYTAPSVEDTEKE